MSVLSGGDLGVIISALGDAAAYRRDGHDWCDDCGKEPVGDECADHDSDEATARAYDELEERLETQLRELALTAAGDQQEREAGS